MFASNRVPGLLLCISAAMPPAAIVRPAFAQSRFGPEAAQVPAEPPATVNKTRVPDADPQRKADNLLREIYGDKIEGATTAAAQTKLAHELVAKAHELRNDPPSCYALLRIGKSGLQGPRLRPLP